MHYLSFLVTMGAAGWGLGILLGLVLCLVFAAAQGAAKGAHEHPALPALLLIIAGFVIYAFTVH